MKRIGFKIAVIIAWIAGMFWLVRFEAFPHIFSKSSTGYRQIVSDDMLLRDSWMKVLINGYPVGYAFNGANINELSSDERHEINHRIRVTLPLKQELLELDMESEVRLNTIFKLTSFEASLDAGRKRLKVVGKKNQEGLFDIVFSAGNNENRLTIKIPDNALIVSPLNDLNLAGIKPGRKMVLNVMDPLTLQKKPVHAEGVRKTILRMNDEHYSCTVVSVNYSGLTFLFWVDEHGAVLKQTTPFGVILEKCTPEEALNIFKNSRSVPAPGNILSPEAQMYLTQLLTILPTETNK